MLNPFEKATFKNQTIFGENYFIPNKISTRINCKLLLRVSFGKCFPHKKVSNDTYHFKPF